MEFRRVLFRSVQLVGVADVLEGDLLVLLGAEAPDLDPRAVLLVQLVEVHVVVARGAVERDRDVDQPEAQGAGPQRAGHQARLASRTLARSSDSSSSRSGSSGSSMSLPLLAFLRIAPSTASRYS